MCFTRGDKFAGFVNFAISIVINAICFIAGDFIGCAIGIIVNTVGCPSADFGQERNLAVFVHGAIFVIVNTIRCLLEVSVEHIVRDACFGDAIATREGGEGIAILQFIPIAADVRAVEVGELRIIAVKERAGQPTCRDKDGAAFNDRGCEEFVLFMRADNIGGDLVTLSDFLKRFARENGVFNAICQQRGAHEVGPKRCQFKGVQHGSLSGKHLNDTPPPFVRESPMVYRDSDGKLTALYVLQTDFNEPVEDVFAAARGLRVAGDATLQAG